MPPTREEISISINRPSYHTGKGRYPPSAILPLPPEELLDLLDKARISDPLSAYEITVEWCRREYLEPVLENQTLNIHELNHLASILAAMGPEDCDVFEGLVKIEGNESPIPPARIINLALSAGENPMAHGVTSDEQLGRFYFENGFVEELARLPDKDARYLDYGKIGAERRIAESGVFTAAGYVPRVLSDAEIDSHYGRDSFPLLGDTLPPEELRVELIHGSLDAWDPAIAATTVILPIGMGDYNSLLEELGCTEDELTLLPQYCAIPSMQEYIKPNERMEDLNALAICLNDAKSRGKLPVYTGCYSVQEAVALGARLDEYRLHTDIVAPAQYAMDALEARYGYNESRELSTHMNLEAYAEESMAKNGVVDTSYGYLSRADHAPILALSGMGEGESMAPGDRERLAAELNARLDADFDTYKVSVCTMDSKNLIEKAEEIAATKLAYEQLHNKGLPDALVRGLLQYHCPLIEARNRWMESDHSIFSGDNFLHAVEDMVEPRQPEQEQQISMQ